MSEHAPRFSSRRWFNFWGINPSVREYLNRSPDVTVAGLYFAGMMRFLIVVYGPILIVAVVIGALSARFS